MVTRKLKYFEYSGHVAGLQGIPAGQHVYDSFETPNGYVFVVAGSLFQGDDGESLSSLAVDRIRYYLHHEVPDNPADAARNALMYANGFVHVKSGKNHAIQSAELSCLCVIIRDRQVFYAWVGQACLYLFTGRKLVQLSWDVYREQAEQDGGKPWEIAFMGLDRSVNPGVCKQSLVPASDDILLFGTGGLCLEIDEKQVRKILSDSMPTHTKAVRVTGKPEKEELPSVCMVIQFYNLGQEERSFVVSENPVKKSHGMAGKYPGFFSLSNPLFRKVLYGVAALIIGYMMYDMFFFNPLRTNAIRYDDAGEVVSADAADTIADDLDKPAGETRPGSTDDPPPAVEPASDPDGSAAVLPDDVVYAVKRGDTWGRIYREYGVCSWFIRNHPSNRGKFDAANNPIAGSDLVIPVRYSARQRLNPTYYQEFTIDKVGSSCQHASQAFIERFEQSLR